jgi:trehalose 6-phosphate phosphatase
VRVPDGLIRLLASLAGRLEGALAILSGRLISDIDRLLAPLRLPAAGAHCAELRLFPEAKIEAAAPPVTPQLEQAVRAIASGHEGLNVEVKKSWIAVHYRRAPSQLARIEAELSALLSGQSRDLELFPGRKVLEIGPRAVSKGTALANFMRTPTFADRQPIVIGDDATDERAMAAAVRLGGRGLKVAGEHFAAGGADFQTPTEVRTWLAALAEGCEA